MSKLNAFWTGHSINLDPRPRLTLQYQFAVVFANKLLNGAVLLRRDLPRLFTASLSMTPVVHLLL